MNDYVVAKDKTITYKSLFCTTCDTELIKMNYGEDKVMLVCTKCDKIYWSTPKEVAEMLTGEVADK